MASTRVWSEKIHPMDSGSLHFEVEVEGHKFSYRQVWENCGEIHEDFDCTCGFSTTEAPGRGCWQYGHNEQRSADFDAVHGALLVIGAQATREADVGCPAEWDGLEKMGLEALEAADFGSSETIKFLNKQAGRLTAAQLRKLFAGEEVYNTTEERILDNETRRDYILRQLAPDATELDKALALAGPGYAYMTRAAYSEGMTCDEILDEMRFLIEKAVASNAP